MDKRNYDELKLERQLCFHVYASSREVIKCYKPFLDELNLTYTQYVTMIALWENGEMTVKEIGEVLYLDSGTLTPLLKKLEAKGLVARRRSEGDERNLLVSVTEAGEALKERAVEIPGKLRSRIIMDPKDVAEVRRLAGVVLEAVRNSKLDKEKS